MLNPIKKLIKGFPNPVRKILSSKFIIGNSSLWFRKLYRTANFFVIFSANLFFKTLMNPK